MRGCRPRLTAKDDDDEDDDDEADDDDDADNEDDNDDDDDDDDDEDDDDDFFRQMLSAVHHGHLDEWRGGIALHVRGVAGANSSRHAVRPNPRQQHLSG